MGGPFIADGVNGSVVSVVVIYVDDDKGSRCGLDPYSRNVTGLNRYLANLSGGYVSVNE